MICPNCGKLISISEEKCPFCGTWRPGMFGYAPVLRKLLGGGTDFPRLVTVACVTLYAIALLLQPEALLHPAGLFSILSPGSRALYQLGMTGGVAWQQGWWWTVLTAIFLHGGLLHIFFNMMALRNLGPAVVHAFGGTRGFVIFMVAGAVGYVVSNFAGNHPSIGASGGIMGMMGALIVYGRRSGHAALTQQLWQWAIMTFVMGFMISNVNNWAHLGGFATGWVCAEAMGFVGERREGLGLKVFALALVVATLAGFVLSFLRVTELLMHG